MKQPHSDAEFAALHEVFPATTIYGCDFHREQAWTRWVHDRKNSLDKSDADCQLNLLCAFAWASLGMEDSGLDSNYQKCTSRIKSMEGQLACSELAEFKLVKASTGMYTICTHTCCIHCIKNLTDMNSVHHVVTKELHCSCSVDL